MLLRVYIVVVTAASGAQVPLADALPPTTTCLHNIILILSNIRILLPSENTTITKNLVIFIFIFSLDTPPPMGTLWLLFINLLHSIAVVFSTENVIFFFMLCNRYHRLILVFEYFYPTT